MEARRALSSPQRPEPFLRRCHTCSRAQTEAGHRSGGLVWQRRIGDISRGRGAGRLLYLGALDEPWGALPDAVARASVLRPTPHLLQKEPHDLHGGSVVRFPCLPLRILLLLLLLLLTEECGSGWGSSEGCCCPEPRLPVEAGLIEGRPPRDADDVGADGRSGYILLPLPLKASSFAPFSSRSSSLSVPVRLGPGEEEPPREAEAVEPGAMSREAS